MCFLSQELHIEQEHPQEAENFPTLLKLFEAREGSLIEKEPNVTQVCHIFSKEDEIKSASEERSYVPILYTEKEEINCIQEDNESNSLSTSFKGLLKYPTPHVIEDEQDI